MGEVVRSVSRLSLLAVILLAIRLADSEELALDEIFHGTISGDGLVCDNFTSGDEVVTLRPPERTCNASNIFITSSRLVTIPQNLFRFVQNEEGFYARDNHIDYLDANSFSDAGNLIYVDLRNNHLGRIYNDTFATATNVLILKVIDDQLGEIDLEAFRNMSKLTVLLLDASHADLMHAEYFQDMEGLKYLTLKSNKTTPFDGEVFVNNRNLSEFFLSDNGIECIKNGSFEPLTKLRILDLSDNSLGPKFDVSTIGRIETLEELVLSRNGLEELNYKVIRDLFPGLRHLGLRNNHFTQFYGMRMSNYFETQWPSLNVNYGVFV